MKKVLFIILALVTGVIYAQQSPENNPNKGISTSNIQQVQATFVLHTTSTMNPDRIVHCLRQTAESFKDVDDSFDYVLYYSNGCYILQFTSYRLLREEVYNFADDFDYATEQDIYLLTGQWVFFGIDVILN